MPLVVATFQRGSHPALGGVAEMMPATWRGCVRISSSLMLIAELCGAGANSGFRVALTVETAR
jgi:hypothetical protein